MGLCFSVARQNGGHGNAVETRWCYMGLGSCNQLGQAYSYLILFKAHFPILLFSTQGAHVFSVEMFPDIPRQNSPPLHLNSPSQPDSLSHPCCASL